MICKKCNTSMNKNGTRNGNQRWKCPVCDYEKISDNKENILVIPDLHIPFEHKNALRFVSDLKSQYHCTKTIQIGDIVDQYGFSRYPRDPDSVTTRDEVVESRSKIQEWASEFPELIITTGNHCKRIHKRLYEIGIPHDLVLKTVSEIYDMPKKWKWVSEHEENNIMFIHGSKSGPYAHINTAKDFRQSVVIGHTHSTLAVDYMSGFNDRIFGANTGCLIDQNEYAFFYARELTRRPVLGAMVLINGTLPLTIPMK